MGFASITLYDLISFTDDSLSADMPTTVDQLTVSTGSLQLTVSNKSRIGSGDDIPQTPSNQPTNPRPWPPKRRVKTYTLQDKLQALNAMKETNNLDKTAQDLDITRRTLQRWRSNEKRLLKAARSDSKLQKLARQLSTQRTHLQRKPRTSYTLKEKIEALNLIKSNHNLDKTARQLGINRRVLQKWQAEQRLLSEAAEQDPQSRRRVRHHVLESSVTLLPVLQYGMFFQSIY